MQYKLSPITNFSSCGADPHIRLRSYTRIHALTHQNQWGQMGLTVENVLSLNKKYIKNNFKNLLMVETLLKKKVAMGPQLRVSRQSRRRSRAG